MPAEHVCQVRGLNVVAWNGFAWVAFFFEQNLLEKLERVAHDVDDFNKRLPRCLHLKQLFLLGETPRFVAVGLWAFLPRS